MVYSILPFVYSFEPLAIADRYSKVTLGLVLAGGLPPVRGALLFFPQILGGMVAAALVSCMYPGPATFQTKLTGGTSIAQGYGFAQAAYL